MVLETSDGKVAFDKDFYEEFKAKLGELPQNEGAAAALLDERMGKVFKRLIEVGTIYYDIAEKKWKFVS